MTERIETRTSSLFRELAYNTGELKVYMLSGNVYQYRQIPEKLWQHFKNAASSGSFYNTYIKGVYQYVRLI